MGKVLVIVLVVVAVSLAGLVAFYKPSLPPPSEASRVSHPAGFSIIVPPGWETHRLFVDARNQPVSLLRSYPARSTGTQPELTAEMIDPTTFGDGDTIEAEADQRWSLTLFRQLDGKWFRITISVPEVDRTGRDDWLPYLESIALAAPQEGDAAATIPPPVVEEGGPSLIPRQ